MRTRTVMLLFSALWLASCGVSNQNGSGHQASPQVKTIEFDVTEATSETPDGITAQSTSEPAGLAVHFVVGQTSAGTVTRMDLPAAMNSDGQRRTVVIGGSHRTPQVLFTQSRRVDTELSQGLSKGLSSQSVQSPGSNDQDDDILGITPAGALKRGDPSALLNQLKQAGFSTSLSGQSVSTQRVIQPSANTILLSRKQSTATGEQNVTVAYDKDQQTITEFATQQMRANVVVRSHGKVKYKTLQGVAAPVPFQQNIQVEIERTGEARVTMIPLLTATKVLGANEQPVLKPGEFIAAHYTAPDNILNPNESTLRAIITYQNLRVSAMDENSLNGSN